MKDFRKNVIISLVMIFAVLAIMTHGVFASPNFILTPGNNVLSNQTLNQANNTTTNNVTNNTTRNTTVLNTSNNTTVVNNINQNVTKDLPKTGENDTYVIAGIGILAIVIGGVAFIRSKKYDM